MKLYVIRHGETTWNVERKLQGASDTELNKNGIALAIKTGKAMKEIPFDLCFPVCFIVCASCVQNRCQ